MFFLFVWVFFHLAGWQVFGNTCTEENITMALSEIELMLPISKQNIIRLADYSLQKGNQFNLR
jgi:hypothetical protein